MPGEPDILYHYTTGQGLIGILQNGCLWATDRSFLNDRSESLHGVSVLTDVCERLQQTIEAEMPASVEAKEMVDGYIDRLKAGHEAVTGYTWFVASLCEHPDLLSQWIGYGHDGGYCVGFDMAGLREKSGVGDTGAFGIRRVIYDRGKQIQQLLARAEPYIPGALGADEDAKAEAEQKATLGTFVDLLCCKNVAFAHEAEWRIWDIAVSKTRPKFRTAPRMGVIPYVELDIGSKKNSIVREIWIGPSDMGPECVRAVELLLKTFKLPEVKVKRSEIPIRW